MAFLRCLIHQCSLMARETGVQSQVESYQRLKKWYFMPSCLTLSIIRYGSRVKWSNPGKGVAPSSTPWCSSYRKGRFWISLNYTCQLYLLIHQCSSLSIILSLSHEGRWFPFSFHIWSAIPNFLTSPQYTAF